MPLISTDVFSIIALCFTIGLAKRNIAVSNKKNMVYIYASATTIILMILEIATILMESSSNSTIIVFNRIANSLGFSLSPVVPFILLFYNSNKKRIGFLTVPLFFNILMCVLSYKTGLIFFVDAQNHYSRGNLFLMPTIISMFYYALFLKAIIKNILEYEMEDIKVLAPVLFIPVVAIILQILFRNLLLIWSSASISLLLYYIFLLELQYRYDVQTKIRNRAAFEKEMEQSGNDDKNVAIVMFDINNLKITNDKYGHKTGDELIYNTAKIIEKSFMGIGKAYRIGGDEFCVICKDISEELLESAMANLDDSLVKINQNRNIKIVVAYGHAVYNKNGSVSIYSTFVQADKAMYTHKTKLKEFHAMNH